MPSQLTNAQIVQAVSDIYTAAGGGAAGQAAVRSAATQYGLTITDIATAFTSTGNADIFNAAMGTTIEPIPLEPVTSYNEPIPYGPTTDLTWEISVADSLLQYYRDAGGGPAGILAALSAMVSHRIVSNELADFVRNAATAQALSMDPAEKQWILDSVTLFVSTYERAGGGSSGIDAIFNLAHTNPNYNFFMNIPDTLTLLLAATMEGPVTSPYGPDIATTTQRVSIATPVSAQATLVTSAVSLYNSGGAPAVVASMFANGITVEALNAAVQTTGIQIDPTAAGLIVSTYRAIEGQSRRINSQGNVVAVRGDWNRRLWLVDTTNQGTIAVAMDGVSMPPAAPQAVSTAVFTPPPTPTLTNEQIINAAGEIYTRMRGGSGGYQAILAALPGSGVTWERLDEAMRLGYGGAVYATWQAMKRGQYPTTVISTTVVAPPPLTAAPPPSTAVAPPPAALPPRQAAAAVATAVRSAESIVDAATTLYRAAGGGDAGFTAIGRAGAESVPYLGFEAIIAAFRVAYNGTAWPAIVTEARRNPGTGMAQNIITIAGPAPVATPPPPPSAAPPPAPPPSAPPSPVPAPTDRVTGRVTMSPESIVDSTSAIYTRFGGGSAGLNAAKANAAANNVPWDTVRNAFATAYGGSVAHVFETITGEAPGSLRAGLLEGVNPWLLGGLALAAVLALGAKRK